MTRPISNWRFQWQSFRAIVIASSLAAATARLPASPNLPAQLLEAEAARVAAIEKASRATLAVFAAEKSGGGGSGVVITRDGFCADKLSRRTAVRQAHEMWPE